MRTCHIQRDNEIPLECFARCPTSLSGWTLTKLNQHEHISLPQNKTNVSLFLCFLGTLLRVYLIKSCCHQTTGCGHEENNPHSSNTEQQLMLEMSKKWVVTIWREKIWQGWRRHPLSWSVQLQWHRLKLYCTTTWQIQNAIIHVREKSVVIYLHSGSEDEMTNTLMPNTFFCLDTDEDVPVPPPCIKDQIRLQCYDFSHCKIFKGLTTAASSDVTYNSHYDFRNCRCEDVDKVFCSCQNTFLSSMADAAI